jgi:hypothetical protein
VARDLGDLVVAERDLEAPVSGADRVADVAARDAGLREAGPERALSRADEVRTGVDEGARDDPALLVDQHGLGLGRADVDADGVPHETPAATASAAAGCGAA